MEAFVECETYEAGDFKKVPYLDVSTVHNDSLSELIINVVNRHLDKAVETSIQNQFGNLASTATVYEVNASGIEDEKSVTEQKVKSTEKQINIAGNEIKYTFPPHSFTMIKVKLSK